MDVRVGLWRGLSAEELMFLNCCRSNQSILKEICPGCSLEGLMLKLKLQYFGHLMWRTDSFEKTLMLGKIGVRRRRGWHRVRRLDGITNSMDMSLARFWELVLYRESWHDAHGVIKSRTWLSDWTELNWTTPWKKNYGKPRLHIKSGDITLPTNVHLVKAMVFPVVLRGYECWTIKKAEHQRTDSIELWCWRWLLQTPWTARRSKQSILKEISTEYSLLRLKLQYFGHLMGRADSL